MKWKNHSYYNQLKHEHFRRGRFFWHRKFAWRPIAIPEVKYDHTVIPAHYVWLEYVEAVYALRDKYNRSDEIFRGPDGGSLENRRWHYRTYNGAKPRGQNLPLPDGASDTEYGIYASMRSVCGSGFSNSGI
jgi:hypothetical protein